ncbi:MAG TPA: PhnD/SsuA/transferrin family substrate-binding protein, partial [Thermoanaerobaculia bacterium]|nr:PhnD/SsuA/transferrin family substrate-binding protein [Thermoanaerobaculia bacterium]
MAHTFTVSPDFSPRLAPGWFVFNTWLQRTLEMPIHLELFEGFDAQREAIRADKVDLIYANPFDASMLVREKGFRAVAAPADKSDEALVVVAEGNPVQRVLDLLPGCRFASTDDPDVHRMCMILLEPADLHSGNIQMVTCDSYVLVAKELIQGKVDAGFFLEAAFEELSSMVRSQLKPIGRSRIQVVRHVLLIGPSLASKQAELATALAAMA